MNILKVPENYTLSIGDKVCYSMSQGVVIGTILALESNHYNYDGSFIYGFLIGFYEGRDKNGNRSPKSFQMILERSDIYWNPEVMRENKINKIL